MGLTYQVLMDNNVNAIEREIILKYNDYHYCDSDNDVLLSLRKDIINKKVLANQKELLPDIVAFNDALREALRDMYDRAHCIWDKMVDITDEGDGKEMELTAKCYLDADYPALHPIQGDDRQDLWYALCDGEGLDPELTEDLHLISQFHNLFQHMLFAITDFIYVRKFRTEINIEITKS